MISTNSILEPALNASELGALLVRNACARSIVPEPPEEMACTCASSFKAVLNMDVDHGINLMDSMPISKFKATCLAALERVRRTGRPLRVTRFGKPIADIVPPAAEASRSDWLGSMRGTVTIKGDITRPSSELVDWSLE